MKRDRSFEGVIDEEYKKLVKLELHPTMNKLVMKLVMPYIFPGFYGSSCNFAFRSYLSLNQTCRALRYWTVLRRWIAWLCPISMRPHFKSLSYPCLLTIKETMDMQGKICKLVNGGLEDEASVMSMKIASIFQNDGSHNFELELGEVSFFNTFQVTSRKGQKQFTTICYVASSFEEMVLFCFAAMNEKKIEKENVQFACFAGWKDISKFIIFSEDKKATFMDRYLLGRLKEIGFSAPQDWAFTKNIIPKHCHQFFWELCDTQGKRKAGYSTFERLQMFVKFWFPTDIIDLRGKTAFELEIIFN